MSRESLQELRERLLRDEHAQELIRMRAFEIYKLRGGGPGGEAHDWFQAESEVLTFLIEEESRATSDSKAVGAASGGAEATPGAPSVASGKSERAAPKSASRTKAANKEKPASRRTSKKTADSAPKPRGKRKKD